MRKNDRFEQELNVAGAARRAKAFGIKTMTVVVTAAMLVSGVPTRVIAEGLQEAGVIAAQDSMDQGASSGGQQAADQSETQSQEPATNQSNTQEQPQATSEQAAQPSSQDNAAVAQNDSPSAQPAPFAQPSQQTATADIALTLNNASITYKGQVVAQPAQKVTAPTSDSFQFTVQPDNGCKLSKVTLTVGGTDRELKADANGLYTVDAADVARSRASRSRPSRKRPPSRQRKPPRSRTPRTKARQSISLRTKNRTRRTLAQQVSQRRPMLKRRTIPSRLAGRSLLMAFPVILLIAGPLLMRRLLQFLTFYTTPVGLR